jgi:hypothetical protein
VAFDIGRQLSHSLDFPNFDFVPDSFISQDVSIPDLHVTYTDEKAGLLSAPIFAVEIGFSETPESLEESVRGLLTQVPLVKVVLMVDIKESPSYKNPLSKPKK